LVKIGIKFPESVAEHSFRTALLAFIIAFFETKDFDIACKASAAAIFHDLPEARTMDLHKIARNYVDVDEDKALKEQISQLEFKPEFSGVEDFVRDADRLELAFQAVEYSTTYGFAIEFAQNLEFKTKTARKIYEHLMKKSDPRWWK